MLTPHARRRFCLLAVTAVLSVACDASEDRDPRARSVTVTPAADDGAAWIQLLGAPVLDVTAEAADVFFTAHGDTTFVVILRTDPGPLDFELLVVDPTETPVGRALQVADGQNRLRDADSYLVEVQP